MRSRRLLLLITVLGVAGGAVAWFRRQAMTKNAEDFHANYG